MSSNIRGSAEWARKHYGPGWPNCNGASSHLKAVEIFGRELLVHEDAVRAFMRLDRIFRNTTPEYYKHLCKQVDNGTYNCRPIGNTLTPSNHSFGIAIDLDWQQNYQDTDPFDQPMWLRGKESVLKIEREGFMRWGGRYRSPDPMHFETMWTPAEIRARINKEGAKKS